MLPGDLILSFKEYGKILRQNMITNHQEGVRNYFYYSNYTAYFFKKN